MANLLFFDMPLRQGINQAIAQINLVPANVKARVYLVMMVLLILCYSKTRAQQVSDQDPFLPFLTQKSPEIVQDLGMETTPEGIRVHKLLFRSRTVETAAGPVSFRK